MKLKPIPFATHPTGWRMFTNRKYDPAFKPVAMKVFERDKHTCQYCGIVSGQFQEVINENGDYWRNTLTNMVTACPFCTACFFVDAPTEPDQGENKVIYLPELTQAQLNNVCQVIYSVMITTNSPYIDSAKAIYHSLRHRTHLIEQKFGTGMSDASNFGQCMNDSKVNLKHQLLSGLRILPSRSRYRREIIYWAKNVFSHMEKHMATVGQALQIKDS